MGGRGDEDYNNFTLEKKKIKFVHLWIPILNYSVTSLKHGRKY